MPRVRVLATVIALAAAASFGAAAWVWSRTDARPSPEPPLAIDPAYNDPAIEPAPAEVAEACGACHGHPRPDAFPRRDWSREVARGFGFHRQSGSDRPMPSEPAVANFYRNRAPEALPILDEPVATTPPPVAFARADFRPDSEPRDPGISNVRFARLTDPTRLDVVACDMAHGLVMLLKPYQPGARPTVICRTIANPGHAEVVDLDRDGILDLIVADLGSPLPTEKLVGSVVWLRGDSGGGFAPITLARGFGRVADVQSADFDGDGDLDLVVAEFGRLTNGSIALLENRSVDPKAPRFDRSTLDARHGAIHVPVADLDGDGRPDFVALISQEHEVVVAFLNRGGGKFEKATIHDAGHPSFGSSGIQLVDLDRDGDLDVLLSNGDTLDADMLRPYHGVHILENKGGYPFAARRIASIYGVHRALAADFDGDGDLDVVATTFMPGNFYKPLRAEMKLDAIVLLEQTTPGAFARHPIESTSCDHATADVGDFDGDGRPDFVTGSLLFSSMDRSPGDGVTPWIVVERNMGKPR